MTFRLAALAFALISTSAVAQTYNPDFYRPETVRGGCDKTGCNDFQIVEQRPVTRAPEGTLYQTRIRLFRSSSMGHQNTGQQEGYVYCSRTTPAIIARTGDQRLMAFYVAPYAQKESRDTSSYYALYFAACHGPEAGKAAANAGQRPGLAQSLGYRVALAQSRMEQVNSPEDIMGGSYTPPPPPVARAPLDDEGDLDYGERPLPPRDVGPRW